ncbi:MAG: hypothetical protein QOH21_2385 [Acidobacteriota bacterium]|jgi:uncharacterized protein with NRDE domain|nr:hypothetical protein [Acidobacteriota bacterium]
MCLIAIAHLASSRFPLVIAANRDEDHQRPTREAHAWDDAPRVVGGRDVLHVGTWLAMTRDGRFGAVTNLRGALPRSRSRGFLVRDFVMSQQSPLEYAQAIEVEEYAGFHLLVGEAGSEVAYVASAAHALAPGIYGISNAPEGELWPKEAAVRNALDGDDPLEELFAFLGTSRDSGDPMQEAFITGERYGTRSSTVIVATPDALVFAEQSFGPGGVRVGERRTFSFAWAGRS